MKTISIINLKGGVGKSISSINIAYVLATVFNKRVLLIDNDKQGNTSKFFGLHDYEHKNISNLMTDRIISVWETIQKTSYKNLDIITSNMNLLKADKEVLLDMSRPQQTRLKNALGKVSNDYDFCIIDNAPDINMSVINALVCSDDVLVPIKIDKFAFEGISLLLEQISDVKEFNSNLNFGGCFITMYQKNNINIQGDSWLNDNKEFKLFSTKIRKTVKVDESTFIGKPLLEYAKNSTASKDYISLVSEYISKYVIVSDTN